MKPAAVILCLTPFFPLRGADPESVVIFPCRAMSRFSPGSHSVIAEETWAAYREGRSWLVFNSEQTDGPASQVVSLPEAAKQVVSDLSPTHLYANRGREIWRRARPGGEWEKFFDSPWQFHTFKVVDDRRVILIWNVSPEAFPDCGPVDKSPVWVTQKGLKTGSQALLEDWDAEARKLNRRLPIPEEIASLVEVGERVGSPEAPERLAALSRIWTFSSPKHLLIYFEELSLLYAYAPDSGELVRLRTPWSAIEGQVVKAALKPAKGTKFMFRPIFQAQHFTASPTAQGGFRFSWCEACPTEKMMEALRMPVGPFQPLLPASSKPDPDCKGEVRFRLAEWRPGKAEVEEIRHAGILDPNNTLDPEVQNNLGELATQGIFVTRDRELRPLPEVLGEIRKAAARVTPATAPQPKPSGTPKPAKLQRP